MKTLKTLFTTIALAATTFSVNAGQYSNDYDYAEVVDVQTIYETYQVPQNRRVCNDNRNYRQSSHRGNGGGAVLGGIIGGLIGNRFGKGSGRDAATAAGILTGAAIGSNSKNRRNGYSNRNCHTQTQYRQEERIAGYDVSYDYQGRIYQTTMQNHPGSRVKVAVNVQVVDY